MSFPLTQLKACIHNRCGSSIPKGELWLGSELFKDQKIGDTAENHLRLADILDHDISCLSASDHPQNKPDSGYHYFKSKEIQQVAKISEQPVFAVVDGPFQEMVSRIGMMQLLMQWGKNKKEITEFYLEESKKTLKLISDLVESPISAIVMADDFSSDMGPMINPLDIETLFTPFYSRAVKAARSAGKPFFLHCCGALSPLIPILQSWKIDGFFAVQSTVNDLTNLYQQFNSNIMLMGGIEQDLLETVPPPQHSLDRFERIIANIGPSGDLIISSSSGLYKSKYIEPIRKMYKTAKKRGSSLKQDTL